MERIENKWRQSFACCWLPALLVGCNTQSEHESSYARHASVPKKCSIHQLPSSNNTHDPPPCGDKNRRFIPARIPVLMPFVQWEAPEEPEIQPLSCAAGHLPQNKWRMPKSQQSPLWKKYGHEVSHFLDVPGLEKHERPRVR